MTCQASIEAGLNKDSIWRVWCRHGGHMAASLCRLTAPIHLRTPNLNTRVKNLKVFFPVNVGSCSHCQTLVRLCRTHNMSICHRQ